MSNKDYPEYSAWKNMRRRCANKMNKSFSRYGGRGISVCKRWNVFANFLIDMGPRPSPAHSIERKNNNGNYCKENCVWATAKEQSRNRSTNRFVVFNGQEMVLAEAAEKAGLHHSLFFGRLRLGWSEEKALSTPVKRHRKLSASEALEIMRDGRTMQKIADHFNVGIATVWRIKHGLKVRTSP